MTVKARYLLALLALFFLACADDFEVYEQNASAPLKVESVTQLDNFVSYENAGVIGVFPKDDPISQGNKDDDDDDDSPAGDYPLTLVLAVDPPIFGGTELLTATHVDISEGYAYVSYNTAGPRYRGAVDIIDIGNPNYPRLTARLFYTNADLNSVRFQNGFVYVGGGVNADLLETVPSFAFVGKIPIDGNRFDLSNGITYGFQGGNTTTDIAVQGNQLFASSAINGYVARYDHNDFIIQDEIFSTDLRGLTIDGDRLLALEAELGVKVFDTALNFVKDIPIQSDFTIDSKRTLDLVGDRLLVAEGRFGAGVYSLSNGEFTEHIPILIRPEDVTASDIVTNAVSSNGEMIFMANGGAGLGLSLEQPDGSIQTAGVLELPGSINFVTSEGDYLVAASGSGGVIVVKFNRPSPSLLERCNDLEEYEGNGRLFVLTNENLAFGGTQNFTSINNSGHLLLCGSWTVRNGVYVNDRALFELLGMMTVGNNSRPRNVEIDENAILKLEGDLTVYGDLVLKDGATLECIGESNSINVFGDVILGENVSISGAFEDMQGKF